MKVSEINNSISTLSGIGPSTQALFANLNVFTIGDLLQFYPREYEDRTKKINLAQSLQNRKVNTIAKVTAHQWFGYGRMKTLKILIEDSSASAQLVAFNRPFLEKLLPVGAIISICGKFEQKYGTLQSTSFEAEKISQNGELKDYEDSLPPNTRIIPIYHLTQSLTQKNVQKAVEKALKQFALGLDDEIPEYLILKHKLLHKTQAIKLIHNPQSLEELENARKTLVYEELFLFLTAIAKSSLEHRGKLPGENTINLDSIFFDGKQKDEQTLSHEQVDFYFKNSLSPKQRHYLERLAFTPTPDQKKVITILNRQIDNSYQISNNSQNRDSIFPSVRALLQGDVGSGKTLVAFFLALRVIDYKSQVAFMAPTEILARQHAENIASELLPLGVNVAYLTGNINEKGRSQLLQALNDGTINLVIGTHALFSKRVQYNDLAFTIIDEQHRFGVMQRQAIFNKGRTSTHPKVKEPNFLMMSATPIPQTLALTAFGDLDIFDIKTMPQGRKPIKTYLTKEGNEANAYEAVRKELQKGHQAYFVYPAIERTSIQERNDWEFEENSKKKLKSAEDAYNFLKTKVYPEYKIALIHGKIEEETQAQILKDFKDKKIDILVATTVVEVGLNVPNASCMVIEQADRFGLSTLHQLRGRVGRGSEQSYCFLIYSKNISQNGIARMKAIRETADGFKIAEEDLKLRGPGEITGTAQSGELSFAIADLQRDQKILALAKEDSFKEAMYQYQNKMQQ
ncbi:ATP-dependent DNA helicase RecG [Treponema pectinovorum]|uniref:ATP-dependent DNA helicase RecG n=1 Tax=Treponema pectinovorum TaxID=164 RepID=UPI0011CA0995|nr:ATP-dependent DNA helicase RecG [Treponema pectinovorum]